MDTRTLSIVGLVAGAFAAVVGVRGLVTHSGAADAQGHLTSAVMWIAIGLIAPDVSAIAANLANRS